MKFHPLRLLFACILALAACGPAPERNAETETTSAAPAFSSSFRCSGETVGWRGSGETSTLEARGETFELRQAVTASGAKHAAPDDPGTSIWNKGDKATISIRGAALDECVVEDNGGGADAPFHARGNEPGWTLDIDGGAFTLVWNYGENRLEAAAPEPEIDGAVTRYILPDRNVAVTVTAQLCNDDATGMPHPFAVTVETGDQTLNGCGGEPASLLADGEWIVEDIGGGGVIDNSRASLQFGDDRVAGSGSCNSYSAAYALTGEGLRLGATAATKRACPEALMNQEQKFFGVLQNVDRFEIDETGALILIADDGGRILARRGG